jgi:hypothetical protein
MVLAWWMFSEKVITVSRWLLILLLGTGVGFGKDVLSPAGSGADVLQVARSFKDGGTYQRKGPGTPEAVVFNSKVILPAGEGTYCSGFTFVVVMRAARDRGLLKDKTLEQVRAFQREWYGTTKKSAEVQAGYAMKRLGIGDSVMPDGAQAGDFVQFWRTTTTGHSAVFLGWVTEKDRAIGFKYRSTQESTDGIGDKIEYFSDAGRDRGTVIRQRTYFARLDPGEAK